MFVVNCKNYEEIAGDKIVKFVKTSEKIAKKYKVKNSNLPTTTSHRLSIK